jgi:hypothetical protein
VLLFEYDVSNLILQQKNRSLKSLTTEQNRIQLWGWHQFTCAINEAEIYFEISALRPTSKHRFGVLLQQKQQQNYIDR